MVQAELFEGIFFPPHYQTLKLSRWLKGLKQMLIALRKTSPTSADLYSISCFSKHIRNSLTRSYHPPSNRGREMPLRWLRAWSIWQVRRGWELRLLSLGEKGQGDPIHVCRYLVGGVQKMEPDSSQPRGRTRGTNWSKKNKRNST